MYAYDRYTTATTTTSNITIYIDIYTTTTITTTTNYTSTVYQSFAALPCTLTPRFRYLVPA